MKEAADKTAEQLTTKAKARETPRYNTCVLPNPATAKQMGNLLARTKYTRRHRRAFLRVRARRLPQPSGARGREAARRGGGPERR